MGSVINATDLCQVILGSTPLVPFESLVAAGKASCQYCFHLPVTVLPW